MSPAEHLRYLADEHDRAAYRLEREAARHACEEQSALNAARHNRKTASEYRSAAKRLDRS